MPKTSNITGKSYDISQVSTNLHLKQLNSEDAVTFQSKFNGSNPISLQPEAILQQRLH